MGSTGTAIVECLGGMLKLGLELLSVAAPKLGRSSFGQAEQRQRFASHCRRCDAPLPSTHPLLRTDAGQRLLQPSGRRQR